MQCYIGTLYSLFDNVVVFNILFGLCEQKIYYY